MKLFFFSIAIALVTGQVFAQKHNIKFEISSVELPQNSLEPFAFNFKFKNHSRVKYEVHGKELSIIGGFEYKLNGQADWVEFGYPEKLMSYTDYSPFPIWLWVRASSCTGYQDPAFIIEPENGPYEKMGYIFPIWPEADSLSHKITGIKFFFNEHKNVKIRAYLKIAGDDFKYYSNEITAKFDKPNAEDERLKSIIFSAPDRISIFIQMMMAVERTAKCGNEEVIELAKEIIQKFPTHPLSEYARLYLLKSGRSVPQEEQCAYFEHIKKNGLDIVKQALETRFGKFYSPCNE